MGAFWGNLLPRGFWGVFGGISSQGTRGRTAGNSLEWCHQGFRLDVGKIPRGQDPPAQGRGGVPIPGGFQSGGGTWGHGQGGLGSAGEAFGALRGFCFALF